MSTLLVSFCYSMLRARLYIFRLRRICFRNVKSTLGFAPNIVEEIMKAVV